MGISRSPSYLVRQDHGYCFRLHIPPDLSAYLNLKELRYSLGTVSLKKARIKASRLGAYVWGLLEEARADIRARGYTTMDRDRIKTLIHDYFKEILDEDERSRLERTKPFTSDELEGQYLASSSTFDDVEEEIARVDIRRVSPQVVELLNRKGITDIPSDSLAFRALAFELLKAQYSLLQIIAARSEGNYVREGELRKEYLEAVLGGVEVVGPNLAHGSGKSKKTGQRLSENIRDFLNDKRKGKLVVRSRMSLEYSLQLFVDLAGDPYVHEINFEVLRSYFEKLQRLPANRTKKSQYREKTLEELLAMEIPEQDRISVGTINGHIRWVKNWGDWAVRWGFITQDYSKGLKQITKPDIRADEERDAFTREDLQLIFNSAGYTEDKFNQPYKFWLPILALYTGARLAELSQIELDDVQDVDGIWCLLVQTKETGNEAKKRLKSKAARRYIPIHDFLVNDLRLLDYVNALRKAGATRLFPELPYYNHSYGQAASKWFQAYRDELGLNTDGRKITFHSFRHTIACHLKQEEANEQAIVELIGHSTNGMRIRYSKRYPPAQIKRLTVDKIDFGIDLSHLKRSRYVTDPYGVIKSPQGSLKE